MKLVGGVIFLLATHNLMISWNIFLKLSLKPIIPSVQGGDKYVYLC